MRDALGALRAADRGDCAEQPMLPLPIQFLVATIAAAIAGVSVNPDGKWMEQVARGFWIP